VKNGLHFIGVPCTVTCVARIPPGRFLLLRRGDSAARLAVIGTI
jgi:TctA family transporter